MSMIEFHSVTKVYRGRPVLDDISLKVEAGERIVLFGPSGCGKSTMLLLVAGLVAPDKGEILIDDELVAAAGKIRIDPQHRGVGMVFQDLALWPHMTVAQNIEFGLRAKRMPADERRQRVTDMAALVGLGGYLEAKPGELSGGEQQRVALARALALAPRILLMDEPLSALDEELNRQIRREILRLHAELEFTLVYVTHNRDEADELGTRILYLRQGRIDSASNDGSPGGLASLSR